MKKFAVRCFGYSIAFVLTFSTLLFAQTTQLLSVPDAGQPTADSGSGDSITPVISADGRYVLFASTANNLVVIGTNPIPAVAPSPLNVYLRDRAAATTTLVSVNSSGTGGGNDNSWPVSISTNGQFVLFESAASNLVSGDTNKSIDTFVRDLTHGQTLLVSVNTNGLSGNRDSSGSAMTPDGRYVTFLSSAFDLVSNDTNRIPDVFVRDLQTSNTVLVSVGAGTVLTSAQPSIISPDISSDGRYVLFTSLGTNLVPEVQTTNEVYLRDLVAGTTVWASSGATQAAWAVFGSTKTVSYNYILSGDGRFVSYEANSFNPNGTTTGLILRYDALSGLTDIINTNALVLPLGNNRSLDATPDGRFVAFIASTNGPLGTRSSVYVWDGQSGSTTLASGDLNGQVPSNSVCAWPVLGSSAQYVAFLSAGSGLVSNTVSGDFHLYRRDLQAGSTILIDSSTNDSGALLNTTPIPAFSADGQLVAFESSDAKLVPRDPNRSLDVFVRNIGSNSAELISVRDSTLPSNSPNGPNTLSLFSVSSDGRFIAFSTDSENVLPNDTNGSRDVIVRDLLLGTNLLVSANTNNLPANNFSTGPVISGDGRFVAFSSVANDLVPSDSNKSLDVFVRDLQSGLTTLISIKTNGSGPGNKDSYSPLISSDGRFVLFHSAATDLAPGLLPNGDNLFLRDRQLGTTRALTTNGVFSPTMTPDAHYIAFFPNGLATINVWDTQISARIYSKALSSAAPLALSPNGRRLVYGDTGGLYLVDPVANSASTLLTSMHPSSSLALRFSADSRFLAAAIYNTVSSSNQIYLFDLQAGTNLLVSHSYNSSSANANSDSPDISADGRFIAYRSFATDIIQSDINGMPDIFLYDKQTGVTTILTRSRFGSYSADNRSRAPVFSGDGKILFFESSASDLVNQTFNFNPNIFAYGTYVMPPFPVALALDTQGPLLSWLKVPGKTYQVQFKTALNDPWQDLDGQISSVGNTQFFRDSSPSPVLRFYRVKAY